MKTFCATSFSPVLSPTAIVPPTFANVSSPSSSTDPSAITHSWRGGSATAYRRSVSCSLRRKRTARDLFGEEAIGCAASLILLQKKRQGGTTIAPVTEQEVKWRKDKLKYRFNANFCAISHKMFSQSISDHVARVFFFLDMISCYVKAGLLFYKETRDVAQPAATSPLSRRISGNPLSPEKATRKSTICILGMKI
ncbi:hypothetical protein MRB53_009670 [Persea americana]|uniref:Uncharacterized protein n=1 Tax=Persea americana TaxID=3435 RepID=A0ACC2LQD1_PERAE|nr:hypothetical protein MRB53_009670 [Persea americana]